MFAMSKEAGSRNKPVKQEGESESLARASRLDDGSAGRKRGERQDGAPPAEPFV